MDTIPESYRAVQVHPTLRCNLRCLHCYSSSGPEHKTEMNIDLLRNALSDAQEQGYTVTSFSGGEPLLYSKLHAALKHARQCGMITTVTSNGMLLTEARLSQLQGVTDLLAISLDGMPDSHNRNRANPQAFAMMASRLEGVRRSGIPFGFIFTLTQYNVAELNWVTQFALEQGARLLQIHPLEAAGRAADLLAGHDPDSLELAYSYVEALRLQTECGDRMLIRLDAATRNTIRENPSRVFADGNRDSTHDALLADLVSPLIIEADGSVVPLEYGLDRRYMLGNLHDGRLNDLVATWRRNTYPAFVDLCERTYRAVTTSEKMELVNWFEALTQEARN